MAKLAEVTQQDGKIYQGAALYWPVILYDDAAHTILTPLDGLTPRATLMTPKGAHVANLVCTFLEANGTLPRRVLMFVPTAIAAMLIGGKEYLYNLDMVDANGEAYRKLYGTLTCELGQAPA